jgi:hypothetical protein
MKNGNMFIGFTPAVSKRSLKAMCQKTRKLNVRNRTDLSLDEIAKWCNPILRGWMNYYGAFRRSELYSLCRHFNKTLVAWAMKKYKHFKGHKTRAAKFLEGIAKCQSYLFVHWSRGMVGAFA